MILIAIVWSCWGWIFHWAEPEKISAHAPLGEEVEQCNPAPECAIAETAHFWDAYGAAKI